MGAKRRTYPLEYRERIIELARGGRKPDELAEEFEPCSETIRRWVAQAAIDEGAKEGLTTDDREELRRLRRENRRLREERTILKKAAAWFAQESDSIPK